MNCSYCRTWNPETEHRCRRCGRRLNGSANDTLSDTVTHYQLNGVAGNLAAVLEPVRRQPAAQPQTRETVVRNSSPQGTLFSERPVSNVIPFESLAPGYTRAPVPRRAPAAPKTAPGLNKPASKRETRSAETVDQPSLDFLPAAPLAPRTLPTTVEAQIFCDAPVATTSHRMLAAFLDLSVILMGYALFVLVFYLRAGELFLNRLNLIVFGAALVLIALFYGLIWMLAKTETPGMRWTHLRLINFDGFPPDRYHRALRYFSTLISVAPGCLGLLWALVDEESLTWHDHISKTFPTFVQPERNFVRRGR